jgi:hypothetical protein
MSSEYSIRHRGKALDGFSHHSAIEEVEIRVNPIARITRKVLIGLLMILSAAYLFVWFPLCWLGMNILVVPMSPRFAAVASGLFTMIAPAAFIGFLWWLAYRVCPPQP